jgi:hypothetical protein
MQNNIDNRDLLTKALDPYGMPGGQSKISPAQRAQMRFDPSMLPAAQGTQVVDDPSFQPAPGMLPQQMQQMYQQASVPQQAPMAYETQMQQKIKDPRLEKTLANADALAAQAARQEAEVAQHEATVRAAGYENISREVEDKMAVFNTAVEEFKNAKLVDPRSEWGTEKKIGAAIAMAMGAFSAAYSGGRNYAMDIIDNSIKRDLDMQEARINKLGLNAKQSEGALAQAYRKFGDMQQARSAVELAAIGKVSDDIKKKALASDNLKVKTAADKTLADLEQRKAAIMAQATDAVVTTTGRPVVASRDDVLKEEELMTPYGRAPGAKAAMVVREQAQMIDEARTGLNAAADYIDKHGSFAITPGAAKGEYQAALVPVKRAYQVLLNLGTLGEKEDQKMDALIKNKLNKDEAVAFIRGLNKMVETKEAALSKAYIVGGSDTAKQGQRTKQQLGFR